MRTSITNKPVRSPALPSPRRQFRAAQELRKVLADTSSKDYADLRDRAAFVFVTGTLPTHLRTTMTGLLRSMSQVRQEPTALDGLTGSIKLEPHCARSLRVENHPMVEKVKEFIAEGYFVAATRELKSRRPFSRVFLYRESGGEVFKMTVHSNGAIREGWDGIGD